MSTKNKFHVQEYVYDFDVSGGAQGTIALHSLDNKAVIPSGAIIKDVTAKVVTACTSGGSATVDWGNGDDPNGYAAAVAVGTLVDNYVTSAAGEGSALLWDDTNDHLIPLNVSTAADGQFSVTIATADLTAGKILFIVEYLMPTEA